MIKPVKGGFQLHSVTKPSRALGPVRETSSEVYQKDEKRVEFFKNLKKSSGGPGSLAAEVGANNPSLVKRVRGPKKPKNPMNLNKGTPPAPGKALTGLPSVQQAKTRASKVMK